MPARRTHNIPFTDLHDQVLEDIRRRTGDSVSQINRKVWDWFLDAHPGLTVEYQKRKISELERRLADERQRLMEIERSGSALPVFERRKVGVTQGGTREMACAKPFAYKTGYEEFLHFLNRLGVGGKLGSVAERKVREHLREHPEWMKDIPEEKMVFLQGGGDREGRPLRSRLEG